MLPVSLIEVHVCTLCTLIDMPNASISAMHSKCPDQVSMPH